MSVKKSRILISTVLSVMLVSLGFLLVSCTIESEEIIKKKLELIIPDDMKGITEGIPEEALLDKPYYKITSYKFYKKGLYSAKADVDFYFLKKVELKIVRKFRYHRSKKMWERYFNEYRYISEAAENK